MKGWRRQKEKTQCGPSGLHFGMWKCNAKDRHLAEFDTSQHSVSYYLGFVYDRWKKGLNVALLKKANNYRVDKLRNVLLLEADQNMQHKKMSQDVMWQAEKDGTLSPENYGGRKKHRAIKVVLNQRLVNDSLRLTRKSAGIISNDAKGCFDRIVHMVAYICLLCLGLPKAPLQAMIQAIQEMTHHVRTAFGNSEESYGSEPNQPPMMGLLQGNGVAGTGWAAISTVMVNVMKSYGFGFKDWNAISRKAIDLVSFQFVDDTTLVHSLNSNTATGAQVMAQLQSVLSTWEGTLRATGGALAPEKSYWYLIDWEWKNKQWQYRSKEDNPGSLQLSHGTTGEPQVIERLDPHEAQEVLGVMVQPDGPEDDKKDHLMQKTEKWCDAIRTRQVKPANAWYCLSHTIMKTIKYPLMATTFNEADLTSILSPALQGGLPKSGIQRLLPRALVHGSLAAQGLGIHHPHTTQLMEHLHAVLQHATHPTVTGCLLRSTMASHQLELGSGTPFWDLDYQQWAPLATTDTWIANTWKDLGTTPLHLSGPHLISPLQRENDCHLMDWFMALNLTADALKQVNCCRMHLKVTTLSDIATADGKAIHQAAYNGLALKHNPQTEWPLTPRPTRSDWDQWLGALKAAFLPSHSIHRTLRPEHKLGAWFKPSNPHWSWWFSPAEHQLYRLQDTTWTHWACRPGQAWEPPNFELTPDTITPPQLPNNLCRATTYYCNRPNTLVKMSNHSQPTPAPIAEPPPVNIHQALE